MTILSTIGVIHHWRLQQAAAKTKDKIHRISLHWTFFLLMQFLESGKKNHRCGTHYSRNLVLLLLMWLSIQLLAVRSDAVIFIDVSGVFWAVATKQNWRNKNRSQHFSIPQNSHWKISTFGIQMKHNKKDLPAMSTEWVADTQNHIVQGFNVLGGFQSWQMAAFILMNYCATVQTDSECKWP